MSEVRFSLPVKFVVADPEVPLVEASFGIGVMWRVFGYGANNEEALRDLRSYLPDDCQYC